MTLSHYVRLFVSLTVFDLIISTYKVSSTFVIKRIVLRNLVHSMWRNYFQLLKINFIFKRHSKQCILVIIKAALQSWIISNFVVTLWISKWTLQATYNHLMNNRIFEQLEKLLNHEKVVIRKNVGINEYKERINHNMMFQKLLLVRDT